MYEIKVLTDKEFDSLPNTVTRGSDISDSLGFADPITKKAYVRYVGIPELQKALIQHEFEELVEGHAGHEDENGIRHKKFFKDLFLPIITGGLSGLMTKGPVGGALGAGAGLLGGLTKPKAQTMPTPQMPTAQPSQQMPSLAGPVTSRLATGLNQQQTGGSPLDKFNPTLDKGGFNPEDQNAKGYYQGRDPYRINF